MSKSYFQSPYISESDVVITKADYDEVLLWCKANNIAAVFYGRFMPDEDEYWIVSDPSQRLLFILRWA